MKRIINEPTVKAHLETIQDNLKIGFSLLEMKIDTKGEERVKAMGMKTVLDDISRQVIMARLYLQGFEK